MFLKKKLGSLKETGKGHENVVSLLEIKFIHMVCPFPVVTDSLLALSPCGTISKMDSNREEKCDVTLPW